MRRSAWALCLLGVAAGILAAPADARDRSPSSEYYERQTESDRPVHGYSGWVWGGRRGLYCDYQRIPNRECTTSRSGKRNCRVTNWTLKQYCY